MSSYLIEQIHATPNIEVSMHTQVIAASGDGHLEKVRLRTSEGEVEQEGSALFIFVGAEPKTDWLPPGILRDGRGFVLSGPDLRMAGKDFHWPLDRPPYLLETSLPGIFVAGDVRLGAVKRVASAVGQGSIAVQFVHQYLAGF